jgi:predicted HTH transcriptional regulator
VPQFKRGNFSTLFRLVLDDPKAVSIPEIIDQIHDIISEDRRISAKSIAEQLGISRERVGSIIHEDLDVRKLSAKWVRKCLRAAQNRQQCQWSEQSLKFFRPDLNNFLSRLLTKDEDWLCHYESETKQQ